MDSTRKEFEMLNLLFEIMLNDTLTAEIPKKSITLPIIFNNTPTIISRERMSHVEFAPGTA
jgi:hypothetical protein